MPRRLSDCHNVEDLRDLARRRLPGPIFHYIDGAADDEVTYKRNCDRREPWRTNMGKVRGHTSKYKCPL